MPRRNFPDQGISASSNPQLAVSARHGAWHGIKLLAEQAINGNCQFIVRITNRKDSKQQQLVIEYERGLMLMSINSQRRMVDEGASLLFGCVTVAIMIHEKSGGQR